MNRNVQHLTPPVNINKNWFFNLHTEKTSKTLNKKTNSMYLNISKTNKKTYTHIHVDKISLNQSKVNSKYTGDTYTFSILRADVCQTTEYIYW
jgi:hypothetical protein